MKKSIVFISAAFLLYSAAPLHAQTKEGLHLLNIFKIGGGGKWDYLTTNHANDKIYVSHGTEVNIINESTGDSISTIPNTTGVHGITLVPILNKAYVSNGKTGDCTIYDIKNNRETGRIKVGENPDAIFYDEFSKLVFVFNGRSADATAIDPQSDKVIATIALGGKPETGVSDGKGKVFVNIEDKNEVVCFDTKTFKVLKRYPLKGGEEPSGLAIDRDNSRLFVGCANKEMLVLDANNGATVSVLPIGDGSDGVAFDTTLKQAYSSNGEGTITVIKEISADKFVVQSTIKTAPGARTIALDNITHHLFLPVADYQLSSGIKTLVTGSFRVLEYGY